MSSSLAAPVVVFLELFASKSNRDVTPVFAFAFTFAFAASETFAFAFTFAFTFTLAGRKATGLAFALA